MTITELGDWILFTILAVGALAAYGLWRLTNDAKTTTCPKCGHKH